MVEILKMESPGVLGMKVSGRIVKEEIDEVMIAFKEKVASFDKINLYVELESFTGMSVEAVIEKFRNALYSFKHVGKEAVVADDSWMTALLEVAGKLYHLYPGIDVKHFTWDKKDEALRWIAS